MSTANSRWGPSTIDALVAASHVHPALAERILAGNEMLSQRQSSWGETAIQAASHLGHKALVWRIIEAGADFDIFTACTLGDQPAVMSRYNPSRPDICGVHGLPLLHFAIVGGAAGIVEALLGAGVEVNPKRSALPPLHSAIASGRHDLVRLLLDAGADATACDAYGATALDLARELDGDASISAWQLLLVDRAGRAKMLDR
jgi:ankyrin repeat protein